MRSMILGLAIVLMYGAAIYGQCPQSLFLSYSTQSDIEAFTADYPNCTAISSLRLSNSTSDSIRDLSGLPPIDSIMWGLDLRGLSKLENLAGLKDLTTLGRLVIEDCAALVSTSKATATTPLRLAPNPGRESFAIMGDQPYDKVEIYCIDGTLIQVIETSYEQLDARALLSGLYIVRLYNGEDYLG